MNTASMDSWVADLSFTTPLGEQRLINAGQPQGFSSSALLTLRQNESQMNFVSKQTLVFACAAAVACISVDNAQAQSGTRGGYSAPAASAPSYSAPAQNYSAPNYSTPAYSAPAQSYSAPPVSRYQAPVAGAPIATGAGCSGPGCAGNVASQPIASSYSPAPAYQSAPVYRSGPIYQPQPIYSSGYSGYPNTAYRRSYAPAHSGRSYRGGPYYGGCGN